VAIWPGVEERHVATRGEGVGMYSLVARHSVRNRHSDLQLERLAIHVDLQKPDEWRTCGLDAVLFQPSKHFGESRVDCCGDALPLHMTGDRDV
jgi:hypothetical protein